MKVTVTKYLNVRVGAPRVNAKCYQYLAPGSQLEIDGKTYPGDTYDGNSIWYRDEANNYYWSGGVEKPVSIDPMTKYDPASFWWINNYGIDKLWSQGLSGKGVKVGVLDSGIFLPHPDLIINEKNLKDLTKSKRGMKDLRGHGTHCAGIIKATHNGFGIKGIASECDFYFGKITHDSKGDSLDYLELGLSWLIESKVDIISISSGWEKESESIKTLLKEATDLGILIIAAAGNNPPNHNYTSILFPARDSNVLSIGGINEHKKEILSTIDANHTDLFAPGEQILSTYKLIEPDKYYHRETGSSQAAPYSAGITALMLQSKRMIEPDFKPKSLKKDLINNATKIGDLSIINPLKTLTS